MVCIAQYSPVCDTPTLGQAGTGHWSSGFQVRPRERIRGEPHGDTLKGARIWNPTTKKVQEEAWAHQRGKALCLFVCLFFVGGGYQERGGTTTGASFSSTCSQAAGHCPREFQLQVWAAIVISDSRGSHRHWLLLLWRVLRPGTNGCPCLPGNTSGPSPPRVPGPDSNLCPCLPKSMCGPPLPRLLKPRANYCPCLLGSRHGPTPSQSRVLWPSASCCSHLAWRMCGLSLPRAPTTRSQPLPPPPWECTQAMYLHIPYQDDKSQNTLRKEISIPIKYSSHTHTHTHTINKIHTSYAGTLLHINSPSQDYNK